MLWLKSMGEFLQVTNYQLFQKATEFWIVKDHMVIGDLSPFAFDKTREKFESHAFWIPSFSFIRVLLGIKSWDRLMMIRKQFP